VPKQPHQELLKEERNEETLKGKKKEKKEAEGSPNPAD